MFCNRAWILGLSAVSSEGRAAVSDLNLLSFTTVYDRHGALCPEKIFLRPPINLLDSLSRKMSLSTASSKGSTIHVVIPAILKVDPQGAPYRR